VELPLKPVYWSSFLPLELVYEHRNYLPSVGIIILIAYVFIWLFNNLFNKASHTQIKHYAAISIAGILIISLVFATWSRANYWASEKNIFTSIGQNHPDSAISQYLYGEVLFKTENKPLQAYPYYFKAAELNPKEVAFLVMAVLTTPVEIMKTLQDPQLKQVFSNAHIVDLILHKPLSPWALTIFDSVGECAVARQWYCLAHLEDSQIWLQAVLKSRYVAAKYKRQYGIQLFHLQVLDSNNEAALKTILKVIEKYGRTFQHALLYASVLQDLGRYPEAMTQLNEAKIGARGRPDLLRKVQHMQRTVSLRYKIQQQRLGARTQ